MNYDRLLALFHVCIGYHSGQWSPLYRLQCKIFPRLLEPRGEDEHLVTLDTGGYEEARRLYGVYAVALGGDSDATGYVDCACYGCDALEVGHAWEQGILRCDACRENGCDHRGCECPREDEDEGEDDGWPDVDVLALALRRVNNQASGECDVRLQVYPDLTWALRTGDASYDQDHHGYWGASSVPGDGEHFDSRGMAADLISQAREQAES